MTSEPSPGVDGSGRRSTTGSTAPEPTGVARGRRLFVAIDVPHGGAFGPVLATLREEGARPVAEDRLHLTLLFMAAVPADLVPAVTAATRAVAAAHEPFELATTGKVGSFGARVVWAEIATSDAIHELSSALTRRIAATGVELDERAFRPHLTLARAGRKRLRTRMVAGLEVPTVQWQVRALRLVDSRLCGGPARWETLVMAPLGRPARAGEDA